MDEDAPAAVLVPRRFLLSIPGYLSVAFRSPMILSVPSSDHNVLSAFDLPAPTLLEISRINLPYLC